MSVLVCTHATFIFSYSGILLLSHYITLFISVPLISPIHGVLLWLYLVSVQGRRRAHFMICWLSTTQFFGLPWVVTHAVPLPAGGRGFSYLFTLLLAVKISACFHYLIYPSIANTKNSVAPSSLDVAPPSNQPSLLHMLPSLLLYLNLPVNARHNEQAKLLVVQFLYESWAVTRGENGCEVCLTCLPDTSNSLKICFTALPSKLKRKLNPSNSLAEMLLFPSSSNNSNTVCEWRTIKSFSCLS